MIQQNSASPSTRIAVLAAIATAWAGGALALSEFSPEHKGQDGAAVLAPGEPQDAALAVAPAPDVPPDALGKALSLSVPALRLEKMSPDELIARLRTESATPDGQVESRDLSPEARERILDALRRVDAQPAVEPESADAVGDSPFPMSPEFAIFGKDMRNRITNTRNYPYRTIGFLTDLNGWCSGTLIGKRYVLTAGHCVYNAETNQWKTMTGFWAGRNGKITPYGKARVVRILSVTGWIRDHDWNFDIGMAILGSDLGDTVGWMGYGWEDPLPRYHINQLGYPSDKETATMWHSYCPIDKVTGGKILYKCAMVPGNSGGPLFVYWPDKNLYRIIGVVSHEFRNGPTGFRVGTAQHYPADISVDFDNGGTLIDKAKFETIKGWKERY